MRSLTQALGICLGLSLVLIGCGKDSPLTGTDSPSIEVTGYLTASLIHTTSSQPLNDSTPVQVRIVGMPGAATNLAEVKATNTRSGESQIAPVQESGSFELTLMALRTDSLAVTPVGVDSQESVSVDVEEIQEFPEMLDEGVSVVHAMDYYEVCSPFEDHEGGDGEFEEQDEWPHDWADEEFDPETEEDCEFAMVEVRLVAPLEDGRLIAINLTLDVIVPLESEDERIWAGAVPAEPEETLWLVHERDDGSWSTSHLIEVP